jgi:hypothetical protein
MMRRLGLLAILAVLVSLLGSSSALAASPWWHLSSTVRPSRLGTGAATKEVQDLTVTGTAHELFVLADLTDARVKEIEEGKREAEKFTVLEVGATAGAIEAGLQELYGSGNVEVTGGAGAQAGTEPYVVTFKGALDFQPQDELNAGLSGLVGFAGHVEVSQVSEGKDSGELVISAVNAGDADVPAASAIKLTDRLPSGVEALGAKSFEIGKAEPHPEGSCTIGSSREVTCEFTGPVRPFHGFEARIEVGSETNRTAGESETNEADIEGGGPKTSLEDLLEFGEGSSFGVEKYELSAEEEGGESDVQAGSHPFQLTTTLQLNQDATANTPKLLKDLNAKLPAGLIGNVTKLPQCSLAEFHETNLSGFEAESRCPADTAVGVAAVMVNRIISLSGSPLFRVIVPVFNIEPAHGEPARFGLFIPEGNVPVLLDTSVRTGNDYGVSVSTSNVSQAVALLSSEVTIWGVPGDARHDDTRGYRCLENSESPQCATSEEQHPPPLLSLPTSCNGPLQTSVEVDSWAEVGVFRPSDSSMPGMNGCNRLPFDPSIGLSAASHITSTPTGWNVDVHVPQDESANAVGLVEGMPRNINVALPEGLELNASAADGLESCSESQIGFLGYQELNANTEPGVKTAQFTAAEPSCPDAAKLGNVTVTTPLLPNPLKGSVYLAAPQNFAGGPEENPFRSLVAMYLVARDPISGVLVKLAGKVTLNQTSGQISTSFENSPQAPFEDAVVEFFDGARAPLATPAHCGNYAASAELSPWSGAGASGIFSPVFQITTGLGGSPLGGRECPSNLPFAPTLTSGSTGLQAGSFSPLTTTISREDGDEALQSVQLHYPAGVSGVLTGVPLCAEAQANAGTCSAASQIGESVVSVGLGEDPFTVNGGKVYLTQGYEGAPFGLSIVTPAKAGPFNLQEGRPVVVRAKVEIDRRTAALTVTTDALPHIIEGFPLEIKHVNVVIDRPGFTFNPTNCRALGISGQLTGLEGGVANVSTPFRVANCDALKFAPKFAVSTQAHASRTDGASLHVKLTYPSTPFGSQANISSVKVDLPKQLPSRLKPTLQNACLANVFETNPAACPKDSIVGTAKAITPILPVPLTGPAYFVSYGNEKFPALIVVLQGYGVTVELVGSTLIRKGITSSTFKTVPDVPVGTFELNLPEGKHSALAANLPEKAKEDFCGQNLTMPTTFTAQNGPEINETTKVGVTGCPRAKKARKGKRKARKKVRHERGKSHGSKK